jgi:hypothetical protein
VSCTSQPGEREHCTADTSAGVALVRSSGAAPCLLGKTWGYDDTGIWVSDGCSGEFVAGQTTQQTEKKKPLEYVPNQGFLLYDGEKGQIYFRLFSYARYLNQLNIDPSYVDAFGVTQRVKQRQDIQLAKFFSPFSGWFLTSKFRYYLYVWSANTSQGDPAQVVGAGNLSYAFNRFITLGSGITSLPTVRSTEGQFPYWLGVDDRLIADEYFRGSYTDGVWAKGELFTKLKYNAMVGVNLSVLGVSAAQLDNKLDTQSVMVSWFPTTGEFGLYGTFGDYDWHEKLATRVGFHWSHSFEDRQDQPGTNSNREHPDPPERRQHHFHAGSVRSRHQREHGRLQDDERRRGGEVPRDGVRRRVLFTLARPLHGDSRRGHSAHPRHRLPDAGVGDGDQGRLTAVRERLADLRGLRQPGRAPYR